VQTKQELVARARELAPAFRDRAAGAEEARAMPSESARELLEAGFARVLVPKRFGGYELGLDTWFEVVRALSAGDASHGWCASLIIHDQHYIAQFPEEAQQAVWAGGPDVAVATAIVPLCEATPADGGFRVSGRSPFCSGIGHSSWVILGGLVRGEGAPDWRWFLVPREEVEVADTWFTAGMRATGSNTVLSDAVFVPETRVIRQADLIEGSCPGAAVNRGALYRWPWVAYAPLTFAAPMLGAAQGAHADFCEWTARRTNALGARVAEVTSVQVALARAAAQLDAAQLLLARIAEAPEPPSLELRARAMRDYSAASELIVAAIDGLLAVSGSSAFAVTHPIQRAWRDIHFAASHHALNPEMNFSHFGRSMLGVERLPAQDSY
jgi:3-hydroxy-9,10-secoandrosta-1,3,5(10)-triene-9,17-dione monooxygenase